ncbi:MAG TPA: hypothetical protein VGC63_07590 [Solirubrobacterales bacterium]|jgi:hypothetical protein
MYKRSAGCSLAAVTALIVTLSLIAEIAATPTARSGVNSSTWTPVTGVTALFFGQGAYHGDFAPASIAFGLLAMAIVSALATIPILALLSYSLGRSPHPLAAALFTTACGLAAEILLINLLVNWLQSENQLYRSLPSWGWWAAMATWGATLGLTYARAGHRTKAAQPLEPAPPTEQPPRPKQAPQAAGGFATWGRAAGGGSGRGVPGHSPLLSGDPSPRSPHPHPRPPQ